ncbi:hypothetical protein J6590_092753 [Homalodisca vitripennis]|nr:hypothetical protein J6590_092753 [Homalodisca vitripennis]
MVRWSGRTKKKGRKVFHLMFLHVLLNGLTQCPELLELIVSCFCWHLIEIAVFIMPPSMNSIALWSDSRLLAITSAEDSCFHHATLYEQHSTTVRFQATGHHFN